MEFACPKLRLRLRLGNRRLLVCHLSPVAFLPSCCLHDDCKLIHMATSNRSVSKFTFSTTETQRPPYPSRTNHFQTLDVSFYPRSLHHVSLVFNFGSWAAWHAFFLIVGTGTCGWHVHSKSWHTWGEGQGFWERIMNSCQLYVCIYTLALHQHFCRTRMSSCHGNGNIGNVMTVSHGSHGATRTGSHIPGTSLAEGWINRKLKNWKQS